MKKIKILAIDDDPEFLEELKETLWLSGYEVGVLSENEGVLEKINAFKPNVLLLDLKMNPKSGFQIADEVRHAPQGHDLNIIAITGNFKEKEHQTLTQMCGINALVTKPLNPLTLIAHIERIST